MKRRPNDPARTIPTSHSKEFHRAIKYATGLKESYIKDGWTFDFHRFTQDNHLQMFFYRYYHKIQNVVCKRNLSVRINLLNNHTSSCSWWND